MPARPVPTTCGIDPAFLSGLPDDLQATTVDAVVHFWSHCWCDHAGRS
ncbi:hypothetical protein [Amycolatopsis australiensis]|nr:hypothetical protein [Amycolatopsis australiensis]